MFFSNFNCNFLLKNYKTILKYIIINIGDCMKKIKDIICSHKFVIFLFFFFLLIRVVAVCLIHTPVISDFKTMYDASLELVHHTDSYKSSIYFLNWAYQMGHVIYQSFLLSIINSVLFLKIVNCVISSFTVVFIYLISKELSNKKAAGIIGIIYSVFLFSLLLNTVLTNQILPMLLLLIAIYIWIKQKNITVRNFIIIGVLLAFSNMLRSEIIVVITGFILYFLFLMFIKKKDKKKLLVSLLCIIMSYVVLTQGTSYVLKATNISPNGLENTNPAWKFLEGLNVKTNGMYSEDDSIKYSHSREKTEKALKKRIQEDYLEFPKLFLKKIKVVWLNSDLSWSLGHIEDQEKVQPYVIVNQFFIYFFFIMSLLSIITIFKKIYKNPQFLITFILIVYFGVYLLIEVMPRYAYSLQILEAILASVTLGYILDKKKMRKE